MSKASSLVELKSMVLKYNLKCGTRYALVNNLGRPRGTFAKQSKLDKYRPTIKKYLEMKISRASIAKLIGCHPQTLYDYVEREDLL